MQGATVNQKAVSAVGLGCKAAPARLVHAPRAGPSRPHRWSCPMNALLMAASGLVTALTWGGQSFMDLGGPVQVAASIAQALRRVDREDVAEVLS